MSPGISSRVNHRRVEISGTRCQDFRPPPRGGVSTPGGTRRGKLIVLEGRTWPWNRKVVRSRALALADVLLWNCRHVAVDGRSKTHQGNCLVRKLSRCDNLVTATVIASNPKDFPISDSRGTVVDGSAATSRFPPRSISSLFLFFPLIKPLPRDRDHVIQPRANRRKCARRVYHSR